MRQHVSDYWWDDSSGLDLSTCSSENQFGSEGVEEVDANTNKKPILSQTQRRLQDKILFSRLSRRLDYSQFYRGVPECLRSVGPTEMWCGEFSSIWENVLYFDERLYRKDDIYPRIFERQTKNVAKTSSFPMVKKQESDKYKPFSFYTRPYKLGSQPNTRVVHHHHHEVICPSRQWML